MIYPAIFKKQFYCTKKDRPFYIVCENKGGLFHANYKITSYETNETKDIATLDGEKGSISEKALAAIGGKKTVSQEDVSLEHIDTTNFQCPVCQHLASFVSCGQCKTLVCRGNSDEATFHCRPSCGNTAPFSSMGVLKKIDGVKGGVRTQNKRLGADKTTNNKKLGGVLKLLGRD